MSNSQTVSPPYLRGGNDELGKGFWQQWQQYRDDLYRCCIKWMGGNPTDAEEMSDQLVWGSLDYRERGMGNFLLLSISPSSLQSELLGRESIGDEDEDSLLLSQSSSNQPKECVTQVYLRGILPEFGKQDLLLSLVQEMRSLLARHFVRSLFERRWRVWAYSGGC